MKTLGAFCRTWLDEFVILVALALMVGILSSWMGRETHIPSLDKAGLFILLASAIIAGAALLRKNRGDGMKVTLSASLQRSEEAVEPEPQANGRAARKITPAHIEASIASEHYFTASQAIAAKSAYTELPPKECDLLTFCVIVLRNGFTVTGESTCTDPECFDAGEGRKTARQNAVAKICPLLGYELRSYLHAMKGPLTSDSVGPEA